MAATIEDRIVERLRSQSGVYVCDSCLALHVEASLQEAQEAVASLERLNGFKVTQAKCSDCLREKIVICAVPSSRSAA